MNLFRWPIWAAIILSCTGCSLLESDPWPRLGKAENTEFYLDRQSVVRTAESCYRYRVKIQPDGDTPTDGADHSPQTFKAMSLELHCDDQEMAVRSHDVLDQSGKLLFRRPVLKPVFQNIPPESIHQVMYNYLCSGRDI